IGQPIADAGKPNRRQFLGVSTVGMAAMGAAAGLAASSPPALAAPAKNAGLTHTKIVGLMLAHEQFRLPELVEIGQAAARAGFGLLATSDHFQPWQANEQHAGAASVTMGALGGRVQSAWVGTTVTCPTMRYHPAVVAQTFASLSQLHPGRLFLGVGSGEALNEQAAAGNWPKWPERWERLAEAIEIIRALWSGDKVTRQGKYYTVDGKLYDPPAQPIPLLTAANGKKSMRLAGQHGDGLITDPLTWKKFKSEWEAGAQAAGKNTADMPVLIEQFVVVGSEDDAKKAAELWRFLPKGFKKYYNIADPAEIQREAEAEVPLDQIVADWAVGTDPKVHRGKIAELFDSGATIVNIHSGQADQKKVIDFYGSAVLPHVTG
ncbi:MAG: TIGR03557 family F420-dependent LLM class oxidoreductase, partial [Alphaproteobacteria bacterium]|nr:TIGR03557 family F420-dependent LLM class oxidoreductase [Alphaproteobacteria bacterium]